MPLRIFGFCLALISACALSACQSVPVAPTHPDDLLTDTYGKLMSVNGYPVRLYPDQREPHIVLVSENQRIQGSAGCNRLSGQYTTDGDTLYFEKIVTTRRFCVHLMATEQSFLHALSHTVRAHIESL